MIRQVLSKSFYNIIRTLSLLVYKRKNQFVYISKPDFAENPKAFYEYIESTHDMKNIWLVGDLKSKIHLESKISNVFLLNSIKGYYYLFTSKVIVTSHSTVGRLIAKNQLNVELWHGMPIKKINSFSHGNTNFTPLKNTIITCTSEITRAIIASSFMLHPKDVWITGQPKTDTLSKGVIDKLFKSKNFKKIFLFMPTYRHGFSGFDDGKEINDNFFRFEDFNNERFKDFLKKNNYLFLLKLHPFEEKLYSSILKESDNIKMITNDLLLNNFFDANDLLSDIDELITDYSSVYIDFLLKNKKIIFIPSDIEYYEKNRGFMLEPYNLWTPGAHVFNQVNLEIEMKKNFEESEKYGFVKKSLHKFDDKNSSERIYKKIIERI